jgi:pimeloyl-ACP methyl ester carboxylesterase
LDLPGHGADADGDTAEVGLEECVHAITRAVEREGLTDLILVGHGFGGGLLLQAVSQLPRPPKRLVLVAGIIPVNHRSMLSALPQRARSGFRMLAALSKLSRQDFRIPRSVIGRYLCNGMDPMDVVHSVGYFGPIPTRVLTARLSLDDSPLPCPVTYVVLTEDRILPTEAQERMAQRIANAELVSMDSCHQVMLHKPKELADILLGYA